MITLAHARRSTRFLDRLQQKNPQEKHYKILDAWHNRLRQAADARASFYRRISMAKTYHVAKTGNDRNKGTKEAPFLTIQRAADVAMPGDSILVHEGEYREWVDPKMGGNQ